MLTTAQMQAIKAAILADPVLSAFPMTQDGSYAIAEELNKPASPIFYGWVTEYTPDMMRTAILGGVTQLDALTGSKRDSLLWLVQGVLDCSKLATRAAFDDLCGSQNVLKEALKDGGKRAALRVEKILATGTGSLASPAIFGFEGTVNYVEVHAARLLP